MYLDAVFGLACFPSLSDDSMAPEGHHVLKTNTYWHWVIWRGFQVDGPTRPVVETTRTAYRMDRM